MQEVLLCPRLHSAHEILREQPSSVDVYSKNFTDVWWEFFSCTLHHFNGNLELFWCFEKFDIYHIFRFWLRKCLTPPSSHWVSEPLLVGGDLELLGLLGEGAIDVSLHVQVVGVLWLLKKPDIASFLKMASIGMSDYLLSSLTCQRIRFFLVNVLAF